MAYIPFAARLRRHRRILLAATAALAVIGAFLAYGPIGIGPGPIGNWTSGLSEISSAPASKPAVFIAVIDAGDSGAILDSITVISNGHYPAPVVLGITGDRNIVCGGAMPLSGPDSFASNCEAGAPVPLIGHAVPARSTFRAPRPGLRGFSYAGIGAAIETAPPGSAGCWEATSVVIHYSVGIRHYTATHNVSLIACSSTAQFKAASEQQGT